MLPVIYGMLVWIVIPLIILALFGFSIYLPAHTRENDNKISAWSGFGVGLLIFVIHMITELQNHRSIDPAMASSPLPQVSWLPLLVGAVFCFVFLWGVRSVLPACVIGILTGILSAASASAFFDYLLAFNTRSLSLYVTLGIAAGILIHLIIFPDSIKKLLYPTELPYQSQWRR